LEQPYIRDDKISDTVGSAFGATKEKANVAGENLEEKTEAARKEASSRADAAKAGGEYIVDSEWAGKATNDAMYPKA
jgi:F0F1-type ATP synthase membrane subunit b/b'